jgi:hypothetical protein
MAKRGWSLTDAQLERRKQNPAARRSIDPDAGTFKRQYKEHYAAVDRVSKAKVRKQAMSRPSPARIEERNPTNPKIAQQLGAGGGYYGDRQYYNRATYEQADVSGSGQQPAYTPTSRGGSGNYADPTVPTRSMAGSGGGAELNRRRRQASTEQTFRAADASMFNSNVTPKEKQPPRRYRMSPDQNVFW